MATKKTSAEQVATNKDSINDLFWFMHDMFRDDVDYLDFDELDTLKAMSCMSDFCERWRYVFASAVDLLNDPAGRWDKNGNGPRR
ncbi:hypothetical protein [Bradyrhizobium sp. RDT46]|uniref:hypothetical protein n=1 Tax=Bradyrhizobium sp. RDT46 TaxID=3341829 RepID=UPI0035C73878